MRHMVWWARLAHLFQVGPSKTVGVDW